MADKNKLAPAGGGKAGIYTVVGDDTPNPPEGHPYAGKKEPRVEAKPLTSLIDKHAPNANLKSTILAQKGIKDIAAVVAQFDPQGTGQIAPLMYPMLQQIFTSMTSGGGGKSGSESSTDTPPNPASKSTVEDALTGALSILANKYTFEQITETFNNALEDGKIDFIDKEYRSIVKNALANLYKNYILFGPGQMPYYTVSTVVESIGIAPEPVVEIVPDLYVQQYYYPENDPYPGYIKWILPQEDDETEVAVFTIRTIGDPYYSTPEEEIYSISQKELADKLDPYIQTVTLTAKILNDMLVDAVVVVENEKKEKSNGKNSSKNVLSLLIKLAGYAGQITQLQQSIQLPVSVLNQGSIKKSQNKFMENIGKLRDIKQKAKKAAAPLSSVASLAPSVLPSVVSKLGASSNIPNLETKISAATKLYNTITG